MNRLKANRTTNSAATSSLFLLIFGLFWCSLVAAFDVLTARSLISQIASTWFQPTTARILTSETTSHSDSEGGTTHGVKFAYTYSVNGTNYTSSRYTFDSSSSSDRRWACQAVQNFPAGSERACYYDPQNPSRAVLAPGLHGSDITHLMFLTPFNIVALFFISYPIWAWRQRRAPAIIPPRAADPLHRREFYSLNQHHPLTTFFALFLLTSFVGIFAVVFTGGFHPTMTKVLTIWGAGFAIALGISIQLHFKTKSGRYDVIFDQNSRTITVPAIQKRQTAELIPMSDVQKFEVTKVETGSGEDHKITWRLKLLQNSGREVLLQESFFEPQATRLAQTFNARLNS